MAQEHTEGPWGETLTIFAPRAGKTGRPLAKIISKVFGAKNAAADARLIAVAPEMVDMVRELLGVVDCGKRNAPAVIDKAVALLAKAGA